MHAGHCLGTHNTHKDRYTRRAQALRAPTHLELLSFCLLFWEAPDGTEPSERV